MALGGGAAAADVEVAVGGDSSGLQSAVSDAVDSLGNLENAAIVAGGAMAAFAGKQLSDAISAAGDFEDAMADVEKVTDEATMEGMRDEIMEMATEIPLAHDELATLATQAGRMGAEGEEEIAEFTEVAAQMGSATQLSADEAGTALGKVSSALNESVEDVGELGDSINEVSNSFATDSSEIVDAAQRSGQVLSNLGMESESILGLAGAFNEVSPSSEVAASRMEAVGEAMMDPDNVDMFADALGVTSDQFEEMRDESPEDTMLELMDAVDEGRLSYEEMDDQLRKQTADAFRDTAAAGDEMREAMELSGDAMEEGESLSGELATETDTLAGQKQLLSNRVHNLFIQMGENLLPAIRGVVDLIIDAIDWFADINEETDGWAGTISLLAGLVGGLAVAASGLIAHLGGLAGIASTVTALLGPLATAIGAITAPVLAVVGAIGLLAAAFATDFAGIRTRTEEVVEVFREALQPAIEWLQSDGVEIFNTIKDAVLEFVDLAEPYIETVVDLVADGLIVVIEEAADAFETAFGIISSAIETAWEDVIQPFLEWSSEIWEDHLEEPVEEAQETFEVWAEKVEELLGWLEEEIIGPFLDWFEENVQEKLDEIEEWWDEHGEAVEEVVELLFGALESIIELAIANITDALSAFFALLRGDWETARENVEDIVERMVDAVIGLFEWLWEKVTEWIGDLKEDVLGTISDLREDFEETIDNLVEGVIGFFEDLYDDATDWIDDLMSDILETITETDVQDAFYEILNDAYQWLTGSAVSDFLSAGEGLVDAIVEGIKDAPDAVKNAVEDVVGEARDMLPFSPAKEGPLSDLDDAGEALPETLASKISTNVGVVSGAVDELAKAARPDLTAGDLPAPDVPSGSSGTEIVVEEGAIDIDARGADDPDEVERATKRGLSQALKAHRVD
ncbi:phage tail tape measure protein [Natrialba aegyptia]|uniref:Phage tail tape measure protein, TP901 family n=1 Tax=Natrialba aegyptia DSM 13077 TaxID=1227491 RepID=M0BAU1_9EURY|nr:phage tail tape measure protein [Natrialba aegyptia]ELZ06784.1 phage tail tape measure protein, TP901 family [Natrialba aegyptia DSM 13077]